MPRYIDPFELVRRDAFHEALDKLRDLEQTATMQGSQWVHQWDDLGQRLTAAGITDDDIKALIRPWVSTYFEDAAEAIRGLINTRPREQVARRFPRDKQRSKVYRAEGLIPKSALLTQTGAERYLDVVMADPTVRSLYPSTQRVDINIVVPKKPSKARANGSMELGRCVTTGKNHLLRIYPNGLTKNTILHELSHALTNDHWGEERVQGHGAEFCFTLLRLVYLRFGKAVGYGLQKAFEDGGVDTTNRRPSLVPISTT